MNLLSRSLVCWLIFLSAGTISFSQTKLKLDEIEKKITALEEKGGGSEELIAIWKKAAEHKSKLSGSKEKVEKHASVLEATKRKATQLDSLKFNKKIVEPEKGLKLEEVSAKVEQLSAEKDTASLNSSTLKQEELDRTSRSGDIPGLIRNAKTKLEAILPLENIDSSDDPVQQAKFQRDLAHKDFLQHFIEELELEQRIIEIGEPVLIVEIRIAEQKSVYYAEMLEIWKKRLSGLEAKESASDKERIKQQIKDLEKIPELEAIAIENLELLKELERLRTNSELDRSQKRLDEINADLTFLETSQEYAKNRIKQLEDAGLSVDQETGQLLRQQADFLTKDKEPEEAIEGVSGDYTRTELSLLKLKKTRKALPQNTEKFLNDLNKRMKLENISLDEARELITEQEALLKELIEIKGKIASNQKDQLVSLKKKESVTESYSQLIKERLIWIKNANVVKSSDLILEMKGVRKIVADGYLKNWLEKLRLDFLEHKVLWSIAILICGFLLWKFKHYKSLVCDFHKRARRRNCQSFKPTMKGVLLEMVTVLPLPFIFGFLSWRSAGMTMFEKSFLVAAIFSFLAGLAWSYSRSDGLIVSNFKLNERQCKIIHRTMGWFLPLMLPLLMLFIALTQLPIPDPVPDEPEPYGRILYIITMALTMIAFVQLFRPKHQLLNNSNAECKIAKFVFVICMLMPTILIVGACLGYYASAILLRNQFIASVWTIVISMFIAALLSRWFLVSSRKLAIKQALKRREALIQERENEAIDDPESKVVTKSAEEVEAEAVNLTGVKEQTTRLVKVTLICSIVFSLWGIWSESLPALSVLDKQKLWEHSANTPKSESKASSNPITSIVSGSNKSESSADDSQLVEEVEDKESWVSLQDLLFSIIIFILTYIAASNIPGLLEITVLDNLNIKSGAAFALTTTVRYLLVLFGIIWAFGNIGVTWSSIQWIAAAVTLGIGFGLQEVFANFVAGLILLYERPIRLGDVVTVGEVSGRVTQIKIRATTVLQFNNHELIVPNKEFITGQLTNWTLNDNIIRTEVNVGVAYGSDTKLAEKVLMDVAQGHKKVLKTPKPDVLFLAFGASSLDFQLRCFVAGYDDFRPTQSDLHYQVNKAFEEAGIEISFPQQDLHIKTVEEAIPLQIAKEVESRE